VAAEEKKSLPNAERRSSRNGQSDCRLHYFPDIPMEGHSSVRRCTSAQDNFQRTEYDRGDPARSDGAGGPGGHDFANSDTALKDREREEPAYRQGFADGKAQGLNDGEQAGYERGIQKIEPLINSINEALIQLNAIRKETYHQIEKEVVELSLAIAQKIICREIATDQETVLGITRQALAKVDDPGKITIKMNPSDLQFINETKYQLSELTADLNSVEFEAEESIQSGGCIIETELGEIDARIEKQLQAVAESFRGSMTRAD